jgi:hypothetical protein
MKFGSFVAHRLIASLHWAFLRIFESLRSFGFLHILPRFFGLSFDDFRVSGFFHFKVLLHVAIWKRFFGFHGLSWWFTGFSDSSGVSKIPLSRFSCIS